LATAADRLRLDPAIESKVRVDGARRSLHPVVFDEVVAIATEALFNAFTHAHAEHVAVEVRYERNQLVVRVHDDGVGIERQVLQLQEDMRLVGEAQSGAEGVARFRELRPDVTLMDLQMPGMNGVQAIEAIRSEAPNAKIVVLTTYDGDAQALRALRAGAAGYLLKSTLRKEL